MPRAWLQHFLVVLAEASPTNPRMKPVLIVILFAWLPILMITTYLPVVAQWLWHLFLG